MNYLCKIERMIFDRVSCNMLHLQEAFYDGRDSKS